MALKDQLLGLGSSIYNVLGAPFGGQGALQLGSGLNSLLSSGFGGLGNIAGGLTSLGSSFAMPSISSLSMPAAGSLIGATVPEVTIPASMPGIVGGALGLPGLLGGIFGGMTAAQNRADEIKDVQTGRSRFKDIMRDPEAWIASQPEQFRDISRQSLGGNLTVPNFQDWLLGPGNQTPELREALTGIMYGGAQQGPDVGTPGWASPNSNLYSAAFPWGVTGSKGAVGPSGHAQVTIPGWPGGMISPLEVDLGGTESPGRGGVTGVMGPWMNRLYSQIRDPNYSLGLSTGGPAGLLADYRRIGPEVRDEGE